MVNSQGVTKLSFMDFTAAASIFVAFARLVSLLRPIGSAVVNLATLPVWAIDARAILGLPGGATFATAKVSRNCADVAWRSNKFFAANSASAINAVVVRVVFAVPVFSLPLAHAGHVAKVLSGVLQLRGTLTKQCAAVSACHLDRRSFGSTVELVGALSGTELARTISAPSDLFAALFTRFGMQHKKYLLLTLTGCLSRAYRRQQKVMQTIADSVLPVKPICPRQLDYSTVGG